VGKKRDDKPAIGIEVGAHRVRAHVSEGGLARLGSAAAWLAPLHAAKVKITAALAERVATKITSGEPLDDQEQYFVGRMFSKEARKLANQEAVAQRVEEVLPEVQERVQRLPPYEDPGTSSTFFARAETIAAEITDDRLRNLFAQVLAGELCRPGAFSLRTLETIRLLDPETASIFERLRGFAFGIWRKTTHEWIFAKDHLEPREISALVDAGLASESMTVPINTGPSIDDIYVFSYGNRLLRTRLQPTPTETSERVSNLSFTRVGRQIASVLTPRVDYEYFAAVGEWLSNLLGSNVVVEWRDESSEDWTAFGRQRKG
jgi:Protein of unknown function (DUF2806)